MERFTKVYILETEGIEFYVRECAGMQPLLWLVNGPHGHYYHKAGFDWDDVLRRSIGVEEEAKVYEAFEKCQKYLEANPYPWKNSNVPFYKESWN